MIPFPTIMGSCFMLLGFILYVVSMQSYSGLLLLILGIVFGLYILNTFGAVRSGRALRFIAPSSVVCTEGEALRGTWEIENPSKHLAGHSTLLSPFGPLLRVGSVPPGDSVHLTPDLSLSRRGVYPFGKLQLETTYPFGLMRVQRNLPIEGEIVVHPFVYKCPSPPAAGFEPTVGGKFKGYNRSSSGDSFHGVRPHQPSDPMKSIHWASSAKGQGIMVKEFDEELSGRVALIMDTTPGNNDSGDDLLDWSSRAAGSLMLAALDEGHQVEFIRLGDECARSVPPFADGDVVLDALARLEPNKKARTVETLDDAVSRTPPKAGVCLILTGIDDAVRALITERLLPAKRKVIVYLPDCRRGEATDLPVPVRFFAARELVEEEV